MLWTECVCPLEIHVEILILQYHGIRRCRLWGDYYIRRVMPSEVGFVPLEERPERVPLPLPPCEDTPRGWLSVSQGGLPDTGLCQCLILDLPVSAQSEVILLQLPTWVWQCGGMIKPQVSLFPRHPQPSLRVCILRAGAMSAITVSQCWAEQCLLMIM